MSLRGNFADIYLREISDSSMRSATELARDIQQTDWSTEETRQTCLTGPLEYKYRVIFVLVLGVICTLKSVVG